MILFQVANSDRVQYIKRKYKRDPEFMRIRPIVAAEVVQLLCVTPSFYDIADTDAGDIFSCLLQCDLSLECDMIPGQSVSVSLTFILSLFSWVYFLCYSNAFKTYRLCNQLILKAFS